MITPYKNTHPSIGRDVFIAPDAWVIGDVVLEDQVTVLFGVVLRGDILPIKIGTRTNIQDQTIIHTQTGTTPVTIGDEVTIGHRALIHSATIHNRAMIGMGAIILDEAVIGEEAVIAAGSIVTRKQIIPPRTLAIGSPAKVMRELRPEEIEYLKVSANRYVNVGAEYRKQFSENGNQ